MFNENEQQDMRTYGSEQPSAPRPVMPAFNTPAEKPASPSPWFAPAPSLAPDFEPSIKTAPTPEPAPMPAPEPAPVQIPIPEPASMPAPEPAPAPVWPPVTEQIPVSQEPVYPGRYIPEEKTPKKPKKAKKQRSGNGIGRIIAVALICSLLGGIVGAIGGILFAPKLKNTSAAAQKTGSTQVLEGQRDPVVINPQKIDTSELMTPAEVYATYVQSTVGITTSITTNFWGYQTTSAASGSGFIISPDGYIITNHHVIEGSNSITVSFYDGTSKEATLIGADQSNDLAVLKVEAEGLTPVVLGDSDNLNVGDTVLAIGNPLGELTFSLTVGILSALDREVTTSAGVTMNLMQTDCAINSGNSGGALFNLHGEVIGITNAKYSSSSYSEASIDNIGFAIPINSVRKIIDSLIENGYIAKPYIGVTVTNVSEETQSYGLPQGAAVQSVLADSPAEKAGLQENDIITKVDDQVITGSQDLVNIVKTCEVGQVLKLTVYRKGVTMELELTVGEQIQQGIQEETQQQQQQPQQQPNQGGMSGFPFWGY